MTSSYVDPVSGAYVEGPRSKTVFWQCASGTYPAGYSRLLPFEGPGQDRFGESPLVAVASAASGTWMPAGAPAWIEDATCAASLPFDTAWMTTAADLPGSAHRPVWRPLVAPLLTLGSVDPPYEILDLHVDHLGSTRAITDEAGVVTTTHNYFPFGAELTSGNAHKNRKLFTGHERDNWAGLYVCEVLLRGAR